MSVILNYSITIKMLFYMLPVFVFTYDILSGSDSVYVSDDALDDIQENYYDVKIDYENKDPFHSSKHVYYYLYTSKNKDGQLLNRSEPHMTESTTYDESNPIKIIVHGWLGTTQEKEGLCSHHVRSYLKVGEYNLICVDWKQYSTDITYPVAAARARSIGEDIANVTFKITGNKTMGCYDTVHAIGHSLGAHICGFFGKNYPGLARISGLDPAKPMYENCGPEDRLDLTDAIYVDVMHTNAGQNGLNKSIGHMDFHPNGGECQPGCEDSDKHGSCSHVRSYHYYAHSIWAKEDYVAYKCPSWDDFKANLCDTANTTYMGEWVDKDGELGDYYLDALVQD